MTTTQRPAKKKQADHQTGPAAGRPRIPPGYGIPKDKKGLLPWSYVTERMARAMQYWVSTVSPHGRPHATPVDGLWLDDRLYFGGAPETRRNRNLAANPAVCVHLDSAVEVVILHGDAHLRKPDHALAVRLAEASTQKCGYAPKPEDYETGGVPVFHPRVVIAWKQFPKDATRWRLPDEA
jgi:hypothetical protein